MSKPKLEWEEKTFAGVSTLVALTNSNVQYGISPLEPDTQKCSAFGFSSNPEGTVLNGEVVFEQRDLALEAAKAACEQHWEQSE